MPRSPEDNKYHFCQEYGPSNEVAFSLDGRGPVWQYAVERHGRLVPGMSVISTIEDESAEIGQDGSSQIRQVTLISWMRADGCVGHFHVNLRPQIQFSQGVPSAYDVLPPRDRQDIRTALIEFAQSHMVICRADIGLALQNSDGENLFTLHADGNYVVHPSLILDRTLPVDLSGNRNGNSQRGFRLNLSDPTVRLSQYDRQPSYFFEFTGFYVAPNRRKRESVGCAVQVGFLMATNSYPRLQEQLSETIARSKGLVDEKALRSIVHPYVRLEVV